MAFLYICSNSSINLITINNAVVELLSLDCIEYPGIERFLGRLFAGGDRQTGISFIT